MRLDDLEYTVLLAFLKSINHDNKDSILERYKTLDCVADRRNIPDVGRETDLRGDCLIHVDGIDCVFSVRLCINDLPAFDALLFVRNETIDYFEFNAYGVEWPSVVYSFELYNKSVIVYGAEEYPLDRFVVHGMDHREGDDRFYNFNFFDFSFCARAFYYSSIRGSRFPQIIDGRLFARKILSVEKAYASKGQIISLSNRGVELLGVICELDIYEADKYLVSQKYYAIKIGDCYVYVPQAQIPHALVGGWVCLHCSDLFVDIRFRGDPLWFLKD